MDLMYNLMLLIVVTVDCSAETSIHASTSETATLPCQHAIPREEVSSVLWYKSSNSTSDKYVNGVDPIVTSYFPDVPPYTISNDSSLQIDSVTFDDATFYRCTVTPKGLGNRFTSDVELIVDGVTELPGSSSSSATPPTSSQLDQHMLSTLKPHQGMRETTTEAISFSYEQSVSIEGSDEVSDREMKGNTNTCLIVFVVILSLTNLMTLVAWNRVKIYSALKSMRSNIASRQGDDKNEIKTEQPLEKSTFIKSNEMAQTNGVV